MIGLNLSGECDYGIVVSSAMHAHYNFRFFNITKEGSRAGSPLFVHSFVTFWNTWFSLSLASPKIRCTSEMQKTSFLYFSCTPYLLSELKVGAQEKNK